MKDGGSPTPEQVKGIQRLVSKSIPQLDIDNVAVLDGEGNDVSVAPSLQSDLNQLRADFERQLENSVKSKVANVLAPFYGEENVKVSVKAQIDMNKKIRETINYFQPDPADQTQTAPGEAAEGEEGDAQAEAGTDAAGEIKRGIPSRESINQEVIRDGEATGGVPGTETNSDIPIYGQLELNGNETQIINQNEIDYLVDQIKEQTQIDAGMIEDLTVSVSINTRNNGTSVTEEELIKLVGNASGISPEKRTDKISIVRGEFYDPDAGLGEGLTPDNQKQIYIIAAAALAILIALIVTLLLLRRKKKKSKLSEKQISKEDAPAVERLIQVMEAPKGPGMEDIRDNLINIKNEKSLELRGNIREFAEDNPEISAQLLKSWLKGGDNNE